MNLPIGRFLGKGMHGQCDRVRRKAEERFGGAEGVKKLFPDRTTSSRTTRSSRTTACTSRTWAATSGKPELQNRRLVARLLPLEIQGW